MKFNMDGNNFLTDEDIAEIVPLIIKTIPRDVTCDVVFERGTDGKKLRFDTRCFINNLIPPFGYLNLDEEVENLDSIAFYYKDGYSGKHMFFRRDFKTKAWNLFINQVGDRWGIRYDRIKSIVVDDRMNIENIKSWLDKHPEKEYEMNVNKIYIIDEKRPNQLEQNWSYKTNKNSIDTIYITLDDALELKNNANAEEALIVVSNLKDVFYLVKNDIRCSYIQLLHLMKEDYKEVINNNLMLDNSDMEYLELINQSNKIIDFRSDPTEEFISFDKYFKKMKIRALGYDKHTTREVAMFVSSFIKDNYKLAESLGDSKVIIKHLNGKEEISNIVDRFSYKNQYKIEDTYEDISSIYLNIKNVEISISRNKKGFWDLKQIIN